MKVLVTGAKGQVGSALIQHLEQTNFDVLALGKTDLDISNRDEVNTTVVGFMPDVIVNTAAITNVDLCETEQELAYKVNALGVRNLVHASKICNSHLIHISTDFVFDGVSEVPYTEFDQTNPLSIYAKSKLGGDTEALRYDKATVLRVAWVFGDLEKDFFNWVIKGVKSGEISSLISDQVGTPTYSQDIAKVILHCMSHRIFGLMNVANKGLTTRYEMGVRACDFLGISHSLKEIDSESLNRPAPRPKFSALDTSTLFNQTGIEMRHWEEAMQEHLKQLQG